MRVLAQGPQRALTLVKPSCSSPRCNAAVKGNQLRLRMWWKGATFALLNHFLQQSMSAPGGALIRQSACLGHAKMTFEQDSALGRALVESHILCKLPTLCCVSPPTLAHLDTPVVAAELQVGRQSAAQAMSDGARMNPFFHLGHFLPKEASMAVL